MQVTAVVSWVNGMSVNKGLGTSDKAIEMGETDTSKSLGDKECLSFLCLDFPFVFYREELRNTPERTWMEELCQQQIKRGFPKGI